MWYINKVWSPDYQKVPGTMDSILLEKETSTVSVRSEAESITGSILDSKLLCMPIPRSL